MELRRIIRTDIAASAIAHLSLVALIIVISEVHPFHPPPIETVSVDIVTPDELKELKDKAPEPTPAPPTPIPDFSTSKQDAAPSQSQATPPPSPSQPAPPPPQPSPSQQQPQRAPSRSEANARPQAQQQTAPPQAQTTPPQAPVYKPPEPDVTVKYGVMLGLPEALPPLAEDNSKDAKENDGGDAKDSVAAKLPANVVAELRRHLKSCAKLPASIAPSDNVRIKLRAVMTTEGMLARAPILIEASASAKGPILMQSAKSALEACQPYTMLPADKYEEWKVLDLTFTPRDFSAS